MTLSAHYEHQILLRLTSLDAHVLGFTNRLARLEEKTNEINAGPRITTLERWRWVLMGCIAGLSLRDIPSMIHLLWR